MLASPDHIACRNRGHDNRAMSMLIPSSSQKLLAVRACIRRMVAKMVTNAISTAYGPRLPDGLPVAECALEGSEMMFNDAVVAIISRLYESMIK